MKLIRWKALLPASLLVVAVALGWVLFGDLVAERAVERVGAQVVGARVDLAGASVRLGRGTVILRGLEVADPNQPMRNLIQAAELIAALDPLPLLEKKVVIDSLALRGVRFGTPRATSGALEERERSSYTGAAAAAVSAWVGQIRIPSFSLAGLGQAVNVRAISLDSLATPARAREIAGAADSSRRAWEVGLRTLNPRPLLDSAETLVARLRGVDLRTLGVTGAREQLAAASAVVNDLNRAINDAKALEQTVKAGAASLQDRVTTGLADARRADYAYARGLVRLPSLDAPDISPALFADLALTYLKPVLYWLAVAEQYVPPGLDPRRRVGPDRMRAPGTTVQFPRERELPRFLLRYADADLVLGGEGVSAGEYRAQLAGLTTEPTLYGRPLRLVAQRAGGRRGPRDVRAFAELDHTRRPLRDSASVQAAGVGLPTVSLAPVGARLALGTGVSDLLVRRVGDSLVGRWLVRSGQPTWERLAGDSGSGSGGAGSVGAQARGRAADILWRTVSGIREVEIEAQIRGSVSRPALSVRSNVGSELARSLREQLGAEVQRAEQQIRARVDSLVQERVREVQARLDAVKADGEGRIAEERAKLEKAKADLEQRIRELTPRLPGGIRLPGS